MFDGCFVRSRSFDGDATYVFIPYGGYYGYHLGLVGQEVVTSFEALSDHSPSLQYIWEHLSLSFEEYVERYLELDITNIGHQMNSF